MFPLLIVKTILPLDFLYKFATQHSDFLDHISYMGDSQFKFHQHITITEMEAISEVLVSDLTQKNGTQETCDIIAYG